MKLGYGTPGSSIADRFRFQAETGSAGTIVSHDRLIAGPVLAALHSFSEFPPKADRETLNDYENTRNSPLETHDNSRWRHLRRSFARAWPKSSKRRPRKISRGLPLAGRHGIHLLANRSLGIRDSLAGFRAGLH